MKIENNKYILKFIKNKISWDECAIRVKRQMDREIWLEVIKRYFKR